MPDKIRLAMFPSRSGNPYISLLIEALKQCGVEIVAGHHDLLGSRWLLSHAFKRVVLYIHWPSGHYMRKRKVVYRLFVVFFLKLLFARLTGYCIVWTCHNPLPHEAASNTRIHRIGRRILCRLADMIVFLSDYSRRQFLREYSFKGRWVIAPHGNLCGSHGPKVSRHDARGRRMWGEEELVYFYFGKIRGYKGVSKLMKTFKRLPFSYRARLVITGEVDDAFKHLLLSAEAQDPRISVHPGWMKEADLVDCLCGADAVVLPFERIMNSSSVILALSYGCLTVLPKSESLTQQVPDDAALFYDCELGDGLYDVLIRVAEMDKQSRQQIKEKAFEIISSQDWEKAAVPIVSGLRECFKKSERSV